MQVNNNHVFTPMFKPVLSMLSRCVIAYLLAQLCRPNVFQVLDSSYLDREIVIVMNVLLNVLPKSSVETIHWTIGVGCLA